MQDESGLLQVNLSSYPSDFSITFNVSGSFLGFTKVAAQVIRVRAADQEIQVRLFPSLSLSLNPSLPSLPISLPPILPPFPTFSGLYWMSLCGTETLFLIFSLLTVPNIFCLLSKIFVFGNFLKIKQVTRMVSVFSVKLRMINFVL